MSFINYNAKQQLLVMTKGHPFQRDAFFALFEDNPELTLLTITENGFGKRTVVSEYSLQNRGGQGLIDIVTDDRNGQVAGALLIVASGLFIVHRERVLARSEVNAPT